MKIINKKDLYSKTTIIRVLSFVFGMTLYALAFNLFFLPYKIVVGGISGISIIINYFYKIEPSLFILITSLILIIISFILFTKKQTINYIYGSLLLPLFIFITSPLSKTNFFQEADILLIVLFGSMLMGLGSGLISKNGYLTGENDILSKIISKIFKISHSNAMFLSCGLIIVFGGLLTNNGIYDFVKFMYAIVAIYLSTMVSERIIIGISSNKTFYIFTDKIDIVKEYIKKEFNLPFTIMKATGGYSNQKENIIMCVIPTSEYYKIKEGLKIIDQNAFFIATDAYEVVKRKQIKELK